jgi:hypothetical protein
MVETAEAVKIFFVRLFTSLKRGVNEMVYY